MASTSETDRPLIVVVELALIERAAGTTSTGASSTGTTWIVETATFEHGTSVARMPMGGSATDPPRLVVTSREHFDAALLAAATRAGARLIASRVIDVTRDADGWLVASRSFLKRFRTYVFRGVVWRDVRSISATV